MMICGLAGRLVQPFNIQPMQADHAYYIVSPEEAADRPRIAAFREWIMEEASVSSGRFKARTEEGNTDT